MKFEKKPEEGTRTLLELRTMSSLDVKLPELPCHPELKLE